MIKILTGWSNPGGSTTSFINLTNTLNEKGFDCVLYGPHNWHLNKCRSDILNFNSFIAGEYDVVIVHFINKIKNRPPINKIIYSSHEKDICPMDKINYKIYDKIHYVSQHQKDYHNIDHPYCIIPNIISDIKPKKINDKIVGIIGSIDYNKQTHISIENALKLGFKKINLYGLKTDQRYFEDYVYKYIDNINVCYKGYYDDRQKMYDEISDVFISSINETFSYIIPECKMAEKNLHVIEGKDYLSTEFEYNKDKIIEKWVKELGL